MAIKASSSITLSSIRDLQSCTRYYLLQSSTSAVPAKPTVNPPGGNWVTAEPGYTTGSTNSLYFCDLNIFSDGTFAYSDVSLSSSYEAAKMAYNKAQNAQDSIDNLQVGSRNLVLGTERMVTEEPAYWDKSGNIVISGDTAEFEVISTARWRGVIGHTRKPIKDYLGQKITVSADLCAPSEDAGRVKFELRFSPTVDTISRVKYKAIGDISPSGDTWARYSATFDCTLEAITSDDGDHTVDPETNGLVVAVQHNGIGPLKVRHIKAEIGTVATDWTPAPEDLKSAIENAQNAADAAQEDIDKLNIGGRNLLRGSNTISTFSNAHGWSQNGTFSDFTIESYTEDGEEIIHWSATGGGNKHVPSIAARSVAPCEFGQTYIYSIELKFDHAITVTASSPNHFHAGARATNNLFDTGLMNHLSWIAMEPLMPAVGEIIPANTWVRYVRRFVFPNAATHDGYNYPAIRPFVYGTSLSSAASDTVNCWMRRCKIEKGNRATDWTPAPEDAGDAIKELTANTECIVGTQTASTNIWTGVASFPTLKDGQVIMYWLPYAGTSTAATLTLTLSTGSTTGGKNVYINGTTRCTTHIAAGNMVQMVYRENVSIGSGTYTGWWINRSLNDNTYDRIRFNNVIKLKQAFTASKLIVADSEGYFPLGAGVSFDIDKPILWAGSTMAIDSTTTNNYLSFPSCTLRNNAGSDWVATQNSTLYLAGVLTGRTFTVTTEDWLTTNPFDDTLTYISLGYLYSTYQMYFYPEHPMYRLLDGIPTAISQIAYEAQVAADIAQVTADAMRTDFQRVVRIDDEGLHVGDNQSNGEVLIDSESVNVVMNGTRYSKFAGNYVQFGNYQLRQSSDGGLVFKMK